MFGLMRAHQDRMRNEGRVVAELPACKNGKAASPAAQGLLAGKQLENFLSASLSEDLAALKGIASLERKAEHKRDTLLPKYASYVERLKELFIKHDLLGFWLVWLFDSGKIDEASQHADWCLTYGVKLPERFQSDIRFFIASQIVQWAEAEFATGRSMNPYFNIWFLRIGTPPEEWNLPDDLVARYYRLHGLKMEKDGVLAVAETYLQKALDKGAKVKTALERVQKNIARRNEGAAQAEAPAAPGEQSPGGDAAGDDSPAAPSGDAAPQN